MTSPYRAFAPWSPPREEITAVGWVATSHRAQIGECVAVVEPQTASGLDPYFRWSVSRANQLHIAGSAQHQMDAFDAAERAADVLNASGWPSAFAPNGKLEVDSG